MNVGLHSVEIALEHIHLCNSNLFTCAFNLTDSHDGLFVFSFIKSGNITRVKNGVNVFKHIFVNNLGINEHKRGCFSLNTTNHKHSF